MTGEGSRGRNVRLMGHKLSLVLLMFCYELGSHTTRHVKHEKVNITPPPPKPQTSFAASLLQ